MKTVPGIRLRTFKNNVCPGIDEVFQLQCWLVPFWGTLQSCHTWELPQTFILWSEFTRSTVFELCWLSLLLPLFSIMSGMVALGIPRGLWTAAVMVTLMVLSTPGAEDRDSPHKCRAAAPWSHHSGEQALRDTWTGVWSQDTVFHHTFPLFGIEGYVTFSFPPSKDKIRTIPLLQVWAWV